jgi:hypothetical protein
MASDYRIIETSDTEVRLHNGIQDEAVITQTDDGQWHIRPLLFESGINNADEWPGFSARQDAIDAYVQRGDQGQTVGDDTGE